MMDSGGNMTQKSVRGTDIVKTLRVLAALMRGETLDKEAAAERAGMKPDSVARNLKLLLEHVPGIEVDRSTRRHFYRFNPKDLISSAPTEERVTLASAIAASLGAAFGRVLTGSIYQAEFIRLRDDVIQRLARSRKQQFSSMSRKLAVVSGHEELLEDKGETLDDVLDAVIRGRRLRMRYENFEGSSRERIIEPYSVAVYDGHLYLLGLDIAKRDAGVRTFRFARISDTDVCDEGFPYPAPNVYDPESLLRDSFGIFEGTGAPVSVRVRLSSDWAVYARHHRWHDSQKLVNHAEDGSIELELRVRLCPELEQWVLKFGEGAEVLSPPELRETIAQRFQAAASLY